MQNENERLDAALARCRTLQEGDKGFDDAAAELLLAYQQKRLAEFADALVNTLGPAPLSRGDLLRWVSGMLVELKSDKCDDPVELLRRLDAAFTELQRTHAPGAAHGPH